MIPRYTRPEIGAVWTQQAKLEAWLEVELAATEAWAAEGVVPAEKYLTEQGIQSEVHVMSAHRDPDTVHEFCTTARARGLKVIIAGAGMSAALPGVAAAQTDLPVIGVPILGKSLGGLDALLSAVQMPPGIPVACVAIDGAKNAGVLAARIINA